MTIPSWLPYAGLMGLGGVVGGLGSPTQTTSQTPGQQGLQQLLGPMYGQAQQSALGGTPLYPTAPLPQTPYAHGYNPQGYQPPSPYSAPQAPYSSVSDYLGQYKDTAQNAMEQFWGSGGGGSARGGYSGAGVDAMAKVTDYATQHATKDYNDERYRYATMQMQAARDPYIQQTLANQFGAQAGNQAGQFGAQQQNMMAQMGYGGALQNQLYQNNAYRDPWNILSQGPQTWGDQIVQPNQLASGLGNALGTMGTLGAMSSLFGNSPFGNAPGTAGALGSGVADATGAIGPGLGTGAGVSGQLSSLGIGNPGAYGGSSAVGGVPATGGLGTLAGIGAGIAAAPLLGPPITSAMQNMMGGPTAPSRW